MNLDEIGFYTLGEERVKRAGPNSRLSRCELVLTSKCNFRCPYCRHIGGTNMKFDAATKIISILSDQQLRNIRFSGGEPTLYPRLTELVRLSKNMRIKRIAISTNGSAERSLYDQLLLAGANDFSISLDACCSQQGDAIAGVSGSWEKVVNNIRWLAMRTYVTVGTVLTKDNIGSLNQIVSFADMLGIADIRIIPAAQEKDIWPKFEIKDQILQKYPILRYRINNLKNARPFRGLTDKDSKQCGLVLDDMAVSHGKHYPCIIYMRESGKNIGHFDKHMRADRFMWWYQINTHKDPICKNNCLDVCVDYNNKYEAYHGMVQRSEF